MIYLTIPKIYLNIIYSKIGISWVSVGYQWVSVGYQWVSFGYKGDVIQISRRYQLGIEEITKCIPKWIPRYPLGIVRYISKNLNLGKIFDFKKKITVIPLKIFIQLSYTLYLRVYRTNVLDLKNFWKQIFGPR